MNVLLTSVGRRSYLVHYFQQALLGDGKVVGANMYADAPGMYAVDEAIVVPPADSPGYVDALISICRSHDIKLMCSLHDLDVFILSQHREKFEQLGVRTMLPTQNWGLIALDKFECSRVLDEAGVAVPVTYLKLQQALRAIQDRKLEWPLIVKARFGFGSLGLRTCNSQQELMDAVKHAVEKIKHSGTDRFFSIALQDSVVIQPVIEGREVCLAVCNDLNGNYRAHFSCEVHSMRAGESDSATSIDRHQFDHLARKLSTLTRHPGIWGFDLLDDHGVYRVIDVNPRFTGDYPFHHLAGSNVPRALIDWVRDNEPSPDCFAHTPGVKGYKDLVPRIAAP